MLNNELHSLVHLILCICYNHHQGVRVSNRKSRHIYIRINSTNWLADEQANELTRNDTKERGEHNEIEYIGQSFSWISLVVSFFLWSLVSGLRSISCNSKITSISEEKPIAPHRVSVCVSVSSLLDCLDLFDVNRSVYQWQPIKFL